MNIKQNKGKLKAFSLTELLVVLAIIGILVLLALPNLMPLITKAKSTEAQINLGHLYSLERNYFYMHSAYTTDFGELGFEPAQLVTEGGNANYEYQVAEITENGFRITATAVVDFDKDGNFNVWEIDQDKKLAEVVKD